MTERLHFHFSLSCLGEGNGNPLQCSCLENPRDGGAWWSAVYGVAQSRTRLKQLSSSSSSNSLQRGNSRNAIKQDYLGKMRFLSVHCAKMAAVTRYLLDQLEICTWIVICKYILLFYELFFHSLDGVFQSMNVFNFDEVRLTYFFFVLVCFI